MTVARTVKLLDFDDLAEIALFRSVDDVVMGGASASRFVLASPGIARFEGTVSLANNGGFASVRTQPRDWRIAGATAFALRTHGDGKDYKFTARTDDGVDGVQYQARFAPASGRWTDIRLPMTQFRASFRGRRIAGAPPLAPDCVRALGLMISDRQAGRFELLIDWIAAEFH